MKTAKYILLVVGALSYALAGYFYWSGSQSTKWQKVSGEITLSIVRRIAEPAEYSSFTYEPYIVYRYVVNGKTFSGHRISFGQDAYPIRSSAQRVLARYPQGTKTAVYFDSHNPQRSVLEPGVRMDFVFLIMLFGTFLILSGVFIKPIVTFFINVLTPNK